MEAGTLFDRSPLPGTDTVSPLLVIDRLTVGFGPHGREQPIVRGLSLTIAPGETLALVGESGSGKSVSSLAVMGLLPQPGGRVMSGSIFWNDGAEKVDLTRLKPSQMRRRRGDDMAMIFQEPMTSLNPVFTIGDQIAEAITAHRRLSRRAAEAEAVDMLKLVGIPEPENRMRAYPHELSGGMRQRVMIAMALSCNPKLLIADEPTTALDVTIQAQILRLIKRLQAKLGMSVLFITHDLGVVAEIADRVAVLYGGRIMEEGNVRQLISRPRHPYTQGLMQAVPRISGEARDSELFALPGNVPDPANLPSGCVFRDRCIHARPGICDIDEPGLELSGHGHSVRCVRWREIESMVPHVG
jgi:oligopeptide transport system ATP-binding protein